MPGAPRRVTLKHVADRLGVSVMTVSNAYNRPDQLSPALRAEILRTAAALGYAGPSRAARALRLGSPGTIGVLYDTPLAYAVQDAAAAAFLGAAAERLGAAGHQLLLLAGADPSAVTGGADGLIVYSVADDDPALAAAVERQLPVVVADQPELDDVPLVFARDRDGAHAVAHHVLGLGHRRLAVLAFGLLDDGRRGPADADRRSRSVYRVTRERLAGYDAALAAHGIAAEEVPVFEAPGGDADAAGRAAHAILDLRPRPTAVLAMSDELALTMLGAAHERGVAVPEQLSVAGFDDVPAARRTRPALTTVSQDHERKGRIAAALVLELLEGRRPQPRVELPVGLVVRDTTAAAPAEPQRRR